MEYGINLIAKSKVKYSGSIDKFFNSLIKGDKDTAKIALGNLDETAVAKYTQISTHEYYDNYLSYIEDCIVKKSEGEYNFDITTGGFGCEFSIALVDLLGPYCEKLNAYVTHDEDYGHIPEKINYRNGNLYANGKEVFVLTFEEEVIDLWVVEPQLDTKTLASIHNLCKKAHTNKTFTALSEIFTALFEPIVTLAEQYKLSSNLLSIDDKEEYKSYIKGVLDLEIVINNHLVINLFNDRMYENLEKMQSIDYLGSIFHEYKKILLVFFTIYDLHNNQDSEETFDEFFEDVADQEDFELIYEMTALLEFA